ncbi:hypothetical protein ABAZ39_07345 [Azospirillum argentinense]|uniref:Exonuclease domain-containing protein n=1 Tax=Azospirillum argentinense TaxID=2970906 RepID=A0A060DLW9_9PROT|nr:3'-5' exonuclease [Azospirillum argentinense]AIB11814.1 hypothetical protein ABAZ39_07345 [Azospirillum argentinense]EZQ08697.1 exonuclease [Azospirillum argentinense]
MILFFDTETTGLVDFRADPTADHQPHLVQFAALLTEMDGTERASVNLLVRPAGWEIPDAAAAVHGITTEVAERGGVPLRSVLSVFWGMLQRAEIVIGHNVPFDLAVMDAARHRAQVPVDVYSVPSFCTMRTATPLAKVLHANPRHDRDWKWPKLEECFRVFFNEPLDGAHDALVDVRACARLYFHLQTIKEPAL